VNSDQKSYDELRSIIHTLLSNQVGPRTPESIREQINKFRSIYGIDESDAELLAKHFESIYQVSMVIGPVITDRDFEPWLPSAKAHIDPFYWNRYRALLNNKGMNGNVLSTMDTVTERILGLLEDPTKDGQWDRRGMVIGHVQSGKTANYTGLICKAADAGYKLIIVIAGIHNNLRSQTQFRIDEGFVGRDSSALGMKRHERIIGVGNYDLSRKPVTFTSRESDFNVATANNVGVHINALLEPAVLVIKKNPKTLESLMKWLKEHNSLQGSDRIPVPLLLIDDEADNASINISYGKDGVSKINGLIRGLLNLFDKSSYVGYTATPFANIFIDPDTEDEMFGQELFPRNFIVGLETPSNYFGPTKIFLNDPNPQICKISDNQKILPVKHKINHRLDSLPESLREAIRAFVLVRAIRLNRGQKSEHNSMLVNASRFTNVQELIRNKIHEYLIEIQTAIRTQGMKDFAEVQSILVFSELHETWNRLYEDESSDWEDIYKNLHDSASVISAITVNSNSSSSLDYEQHKKAGLNVIAVGGFSLSRGLTLEGLSISYFLRNTAMYDTLMQMGRWFGYRPGYEDICRIWMTDDAEGWFEHVTEAIEELREEVRVMEQAGAEPRDFGLKVRSHPSTLMVTARNRIGKSRLIPVKIGLANKFIETSVVDRNQIENNREVSMRLIEELYQSRSKSDFQLVSGGYFLANVSSEPLDRFLNAFKNSDASPLTQPDPIKRHIEERNETELSRWDLFVPSVRAEQTGSFRFDLPGGFTVNCPTRTPSTKTNAELLYVSSKNRVASRGIEKNGVDEEKARNAERKFRGDKPVGEVVNYPDYIYRAERKRPLLILYFLDVRNNSDPDTRELEAPVLAWGMSFPTTAIKENLVGYLVNGPWLQQYLSDEADIDEELERVDD
jgi:hypothetical protein